jgi:hypothetical protein
MSGSYSPFLTSTPVDTRIAILSVGGLDIRRDPANLVPDFIVVNHATQLVGNLFTYGIFGRFDPGIGPVKKYTYRASFCG